MLVTEQMISRFLKGDSGFWTGVGIRQCVRMGLEYALAEHDPPVDLLALVRAEHQPVRAGQGIICSAGCGSHPCETWRIASGHPGWPDCRDHKIQPGRIDG